MEVLGTSWTVFMFAAIIFGILKAELTAAVGFLLGMMVTSLCLSAAGIFLTIRSPSGDVSKVWATLAVWILLFFLAAMVRRLLSGRRSWHLPQRNYQRIDL